MQEDVIFSDNIALMPEHGVGVMMLGETPQTSPASPKVKESGGGNSDIAEWGDGNSFPQDIIELAQRSTELPTLLDWKARALQGKDVLPYQLKFDADKRDFYHEYIDDQEILDFLSDNTFKRYMREAANDFFWFWNVFPELIKGKSGNKIAYLGTQDASFCRWGKMNAKGVIDKCFVNANFPDAKSGDAETIKYDVIDPYSFQAVEAVQKSSKNSFIYPISYPSPGKNYYQLAPWNGFVTSGWADIAAEIPKFKKAIMKYQITIKYLICIPVNYWEAVYPDWRKKTADEQKTIKKNKVNEINKTLSGAENAGQSILCEVGFDQNGRELPAWKIVPIEDKLKEGAYLEDSREASQHLRSALGLDSALTGDGPGKGMGAGSGSDKRVAFNIYVSLQQPYRDVILEPLYFIAKYNGWLKKHPNLRFKFVEIELETLDKSHQTAKETTA